jgi:hypothetical protein
MKNMKRIHKVVIKRMVDESPDTSWLGEYGTRATNEFSIDREHDSDCMRFWANDDIPGDARDCDCSSIRGHNPYQFFNPNHENYAGESPEDIRKDCLQDYARMEALNNGGFCFIGIRAEAEYTATGVFLATLQTLSSGGIWGIESNSSPEYLAETEQEQLAGLKTELKAIGFSSRAIAAAFKNVENGADAR